MFIVKNISCDLPLEITIVDAYQTACIVVTHFPTIPISSWEMMPKYQPNWQKLRKLKFSLAGSSI